MRKEKLITRTVYSLKVTALGINSDNQVETKEYDIPMIEEKKILAYLSINSGDSFTPAKVLKVEQVEQLYGMEESVFMKYAKKLPPRKDYSKVEENMEEG